MEIKAKDNDLRKLKEDYEKRVLALENEVTTIRYGTCRTKVHLHLDPSSISFKAHLVDASGVSEQHGQPSEANERDARTVRSQDCRSGTEAAKDECCRRRKRLHEDKPSTSEGKNAGKPAMC